MTDCKLTDLVLDDLEALCKLLEANQGDYFSKRIRQGMATIYQLDAQVQNLKDALLDMLAQHGCTCGHPACKACERTREFGELILKEQGK